MSEIQGLMQVSFEAQYFEPADHTSHLMHTHFLLGGGVLPQLIKFDGEILE